MYGDFGLKLNIKYSLKYTFFAVLLNNLL